MQGESVPELVHGNGFAGYGTSATAGAAKRASGRRASRREMARFPVGVILALSSRQRARARRNWGRHEGTKVHEGHAHDLRGPSCLRGDPWIHAFGKPSLAF